MSKVIPITIGQGWLTIADISALRTTAKEMFEKFSGKEYFGDADARKMVGKFQKDFEALDYLYQTYYETALASIHQTVAKQQS